MASRMASRGASAMSTLRFRMNRSFSKVSKSSGSLTMTRQRAVFLRHRQDRVFAGHRFGHQLDDRRRNDDFVEIDEVEAVFLGHRPHHLVAGRVAEDAQRVGDFLSRRFGDARGFGELIGADRALADENLGKIHFFSGHRVSAFLFRVLFDGSRRQSPRRSGPQNMLSPHARFSSGFGCARPGLRRQGTALVNYQQLSWLQAICPTFVGLLLQVLTPARENYWQTTEQAQKMLPGPKAPSATAEKR